MKNGCKIILIFLFDEVKIILMDCIEKIVEIIYERLDNDFLTKIKEKE